MTTETGPVSDGRPLDIPRTTSAGPYAEGERETESKNKNHSSRSDAQGPAGHETTRIYALALVVESIRPEWRTASVAAAIRADDRPWRTVVLAAIRGATNPDIRHPNGLRYVNPTDGTHTPTPPTPAELNDPRLRCEHGAFADPPSACCRRGVAT